MASMVPVQGDRDRRGSSRVVMDRSYVGPPLQVLSNIAMSDFSIASEMHVRYTTCGSGRVCLSVVVLVSIELKFCRLTAQ